MSRNSGEDTSSDDVRCCAWVDDDDDGGVDHRKSALFIIPVSSSRKAPYIYAFSTYLPTFIISSASLLKIYMVSHQSLPRRRTGGALGGRGIRSTKNRKSDALSESQVVPRGLGRPQVARCLAIVACSVRYTRTLQPQNPEATLASA